MANSKPKQYSIFLLFLLAFLFALTIFRLSINDLAINSSMIKLTNSSIEAQKTNTTLLSQSNSSFIPNTNPSCLLDPNPKSSQFSARLADFFDEHGCDTHFFMTWITETCRFGERELFSVESLFKTHRNACLVIVSNTMDSSEGAEILKPFLDRGFRVAALSPDYRFLSENTSAKSWFDGIHIGNIHPGEIALGQNLSNLVRLVLLYKFGGIYVDTDVIILKSLLSLKNVIGAQAVDAKTGNWSRLNNAVMIFDKGHPILYKFIEEFVLTFDGNKWGHNGPYLVSRVASRVDGSPDFKIEVLAPAAFYPVDWNRIGGLFVGPRDRSHSKWVTGMYRSIRHESYALHLWNKRSRGVKIEVGSVVGRILLDCCV